jgi:ubiquinone/menaquinone biosynthesis C-methylase UbiE
MNNYEKLNTLQLESEHDAFTEDRYRQFYKLMPKGATHILDVGCNTGRGGKMLKALNNKLEISGLDIVKERLDSLPKNIYHQKIYGLSTNIPTKDCSYDVVVAGEFIEHLYPTDVDNTLAEFFRVLKIGGQILLTTPNPGDIKRKLRRMSILGGAHLSQHHSTTLQLELKMAGFSKIRVLGSGKVSRYIGYRFPFLFIYGSYLILGYKI